MACEPKVLSYAVAIELASGGRLALEAGRWGMGAGGDALRSLRSRVEAAGLAQAP